MQQEPGAHLAATPANGISLSGVAGESPELWDLHQSGGNDPDALWWASLLTGREFPGGEPGAIFAVLDWWGTALELDPANPAGALHSLPESFTSSRLSTDIRALQFHLDRIKPFFDSMQKGESSLAEAMAQIARHFREEERLAVWKREVERISEALRWASVFESRRRYLALAFPSGQATIDNLRTELLARSLQPYDFTSGAVRDEFEVGFEKFKRSYIDLYHARHEETLKIASAAAGNDPIVDATALQNLEMLSSVNYTSKVHLNRIRVIGKWLQSHRCDLPVRDILEEYPRCYCNYDPTGITPAPALVSEMNRAVRDGVEYFRVALRKCSRIIIEELKLLQVDDAHSRQIASILSRGSMLPLKRRTVDILNQIIQLHPAEFIPVLQGGLKGPAHRRRSYSAGDAR
jgi:hypothetical protein